MSSLTPSTTNDATSLPAVRPSITKCLTKRTLKQLSRRAGYNNKLLPEVRIQLRHAIDCFLDELVGDSVVFLECARSPSRTLKLAHVQLALERRGITLCGIEPAPRRAAAAATGKTIAK